MPTFHELRQAIAEALYQEKAYNLPLACTRLGLEPGERAEAFGSKRGYVSVRLAGKSEAFLLALAASVLKEYPSEELRALLATFARDAVRQAHMDALPSIPGHTVTMVFTDLVNSTAIKGRLPGRDITARNRIYLSTILVPHRTRVEERLGQYGGRVVDSEGDSFFLVFPNAAQAAQWAVSLQQVHQSHPIFTPLGPLQVRIGIHTGSPVQDGPRYVGREVDYAARVSAQAHGGQIALSQATAVLVADADITGLAVHAHGNRDLKGIGRVPIFELLYAASAAEN